jgi:hypothetical protein
MRARLDVREGGRACNGPVPLRRVEGQCVVWRVEGEVYGWAIRLSTQTLAGAPTAAAVGDNHCFDLEP